MFDFSAVMEGFGALWSRRAALGLVSIALMGAVAWAADTSPAPIHLPSSLRDMTRFEASGAVYLQDIQRYAIVSDDTDDAKSPLIFLMSGEGVVDDRALVVPGIPRLGDLESISQSGEFLYVMSSLQASGSGRTTLHNNAFVRVRRKGFDLLDSKEINLGDILRLKISESSETELKEIAGHLDDLEVEGHAIRDGQLLISLKRPQLASGASLILRLSSVDDLFADSGTVQIEAWRTFQIPDLFPYKQRLSDMAFVGNHLIVASTCKGHPCGAVWQLDEKGLTLLQSFAADPPEGIAADPAKGSLLITFDEGNAGSKFTTIPGVF